MCGTQMADLCAWEANTAEVNPFGTAVVQKMWSNAANDCRGDKPGSPNDINGDGNGDFALVSGPDWATIPVGSFVTNTAAFASTNQTVADFPGWAATARPMMGDFDGDGRADLALTGVDGWNTLPIAFSTGTTGDFKVSNQVVGDFAKLGRRSQRHPAGHGRF